MSAIALHPSLAGLAVCRIVIEVLDVEAFNCNQQQYAYIVDYEVLEDGPERSGTRQELEKAYERMLNSSQLLKSRRDESLVLLVQSDYPGRNATATWAQESSDAKIEQYQSLKRLLQSKYPLAVVNSRAAKSMENALNILQQQQQQCQAGGIASSPSVLSGRTAEFGSPEAVKAYRKKKLGMRDAAHNFLRSEQSLKPSALDTFEAVLAKVQSDLADALWLAMFDVQQQMKQQQRKKRGRGADPRGVYKANKRPAATTAATGPASSAAVASAVGPHTPATVREKGRVRTLPAVPSPPRQVCKVIDLTEVPDTTPLSASQPGNTLIDLTGLGI